MTNLMPKADPPLAENPKIRMIYSILYTVCHSELCEESKTK